MITYNSSGDALTISNPSFAKQRQALHQLRSELRFQYRSHIMEGPAYAHTMAHLIAQLEQKCREQNIAEKVIRSEIVNRTTGDINLRMITECEGEPGSTHDYRLLADELGIALPGEHLHGYTASGTTYLWLRHQMLECERLLLENHYDPRIYDTYGMGNPILRSWLADEMQQWGFPITNNQIYLGLGASDCIDKTLHSLAHIYKAQNISEAAILFPQPGCGITEQQARSYGYRLHTFQTLPEHNFKLTASQLSQILKQTPDIRILYLSVINNPTAFAYTPDELNALHSVLSSYRKQGHDVLILADLTNIGTGNMQENHGRMGTFVTPNVLKQTIFINSFSKTYTLTGERFGWVTCGNPALAAAISTNWSNNTASLPGEWQLRFMAYFRLIEMRSWLSEKLRAFYRLRRNRLYTQLQSINAEHHLFAQIYMDDDATIYKWIHLQPQEDVFSLFEKTGIAGVPGSCFGYTDDYVRLSVGIIPVPYQ